MKVAKVAEKVSEPIELEVVEEKPKKERKKTGRKPGSKNGSKHFKILQLRQRGNTLVDIAEKLNTDPSAVSKVLKKWEETIPDLKAAKEFRELRPNILSGLHSKVLNELSKDATLARARPGELAKIADVVHKQERLENGLSTANKAEIRYTKVLLPDSGKPPE